MTNTLTITCTCRGYNPADPCGHGDVADGCPKHDPAPHFFCTSRECRGEMRPTLRDQDDEGQYLCVRCGETIWCDECGQAWTDDHQCDGDDEESKIADDLDAASRLARAQERSRVIAEAKAKNAAARAGRIADKEGVVGG